MSVAGQPPLTYDAAGQRTRTRLPNGQTLDYTYDAAGQLAAIVYKNADGTAAGDLAYTYDALGQRRTVSGSLARSGVPEPLDAATHDAGNRLLRIGGQTLTYDANGNLTGDGSNVYTWNARNQLVQISGAANAAYTYDALGRRQTKSLDGWSTAYVYDGYNLVQEWEGGQVKANYLTGGLDEIFARQSGSGAAARTLNYLTDALGSTLRLSDENGDTVADYTYDPYGNTTVQLAAGASVENPFQYTGRENDGNGLYYYRARYYSPAMQRFISEDPIGLAGGVNFYAYVSGNPISFNDPLGLGKWDRFYGLPKKFWKWLHREDGGKLIKELKDPKTGQISKEAADEWYKIWKKEQGGFVDPGLFELLIPWGLTPSELACSEIDCDHNGIPDHLEKDKCE